MQISDTDRRLLRQLLADPAAPVSQLAERADVPAATATRRLERLRAIGVLRGAQRIIHWPSLGFAVQVSLRITLDKTDPRAFDEFIAKARDVPEVIEIQTFLGRVDVRLSVLARDMGHYQDVYRSRILTLPHIADIEALMHVATIKEVAGVPL